jgi:periplasmic protein TonB
VKSHLLPRVDSDRDFYLGAAFSAIFFALIFMLFLRILNGLGEIHSYALKRSTTITVSLDTVPVITSKKSNTPKPQPKEKVESASVKEKTSTPPQDISSLFSDVQTQKIVHKADPKKSEQTNKAQIAALQKRIKTIQKRSPSVTADQVKNLKLVRPTQDAGGQKASGGKDVDAYYAKIQATIYDNFFPPSDSEGSVALIRIWLSPSGKMTRFMILRNSGNTSFDEEVRQLEQRLRRVTFENNPRGNEAVLDVSLVSKE